MNKYPIKYNPDYLVLASNEIIRSKQDSLTLLEAKLIRLAIAQIVEDDTDLRTYKIQAKELADFLEISPVNVYHDLQEIAEPLMRKIIKIIQPDTKRNGKPNYKIIHWVDTAIYEDGCFTFKLSEELKPYIVGLYNLFAAYALAEIIKLPTTNSLRLYELLQSFINIRDMKKRPQQTYIMNRKLKENEISFSIEWLREYFDCIDKYPNTSDFVKRIIDSSVKAINEKTSTPIEYEVIKQGKSIKHIIFKYLDYDSEVGKQILNKLRIEAKNEYEKENERI